MSADTQDSDLMAFARHDEAPSAPSSKVSAGRHTFDTGTKRQSHQSGRLMPLQKRAHYVRIISIMETDR